MATGTLRMCTCAPVAGSGGSKTLGRRDGTLEPHLTTTLLWPPLPVGPVWGPGRLRPFCSRDEPPGAAFLSCCCAWGLRRCWWWKPATHGELPWLGAWNVLSVEGEWKVLSALPCAHVGGGLP